MQINYVPAGDVAKAFHSSNAFTRGLMGPVGSSKSSACWMELFSRACEQRPNKQGVRRFKAAVLRNTYPELKSTTIRTVQEWCPESILKFKWDTPITAVAKFPLGDGTTLEFEAVFLALERPEEVDKIGSLEITAGWINEVREVDKSIYDKLTERVGRFPPVREGGPTWRGVVLDTNPPDVDHWYYKLAEKADYELVEQTDQAEKKLREMGFLKEGEPLMEFFHQPGGLLLRPDGQYEANPLAENISNLDGGHAYYFRQLAGKTKEWIKAQLLGQYATLTSGRPVYPEYSDEIHCAKTPFGPVPRVPLVLGFDYGLTPAVAICQVTPRGQFRIIDELTSNGMGIRQFARDGLRPHLAQYYPEWARSPESMIQCVGDPSGMSRSDIDERTCFMELADEGFICMPAITNEPLARNEAVKKFLLKMTDGQPGLLISPKAAMLRQGFLGKYFYERVQVTGKNIYRDKPCKNEYSHVHNGLEYAALHVNHVQLGSWTTKDRIKYPEKSGII